MKKAWFLLLAVAALQGADPVLVPRIEGEWWQVAGDPDLGKYTTPKQQPVDFAVWQAADGTWQLWSCVRGTNCGGRTRLFYRWQGASLADRDWRPMGIAMEADSAFGETLGGLQAPHVIKVGREYIMFYGDWEHICMAKGVDGKTFARQLLPNGKSGMFSEGPGNNTRDVMALRIGNLFHLYYTAYPNPGCRLPAHFRRPPDVEFGQNSGLRRRGGHKTWFRRMPVRLPPQGRRLLLSVPDATLQPESADQRVPFQGPHRFWSE